MTRIAMIRHGATAWTEERRLQGRFDLGLSAAGRETVARWRLPPEVGGFIWASSPLRRCRETALILRRQFAATGAATGDAWILRIEPRLIEMSYGEWEGRRLADLRAQHGPAMMEWEARGLDLRPPGGESPRDVQRRLVSWLAECAAGGADCFAITHRGVIRAVYALATGWSMIGKPPVRLRDAALHLFTLADDGTPRPERLNLTVAPEPPLVGVIP